MKSIDKSYTVATGYLAPARGTVISLSGHQNTEFGARTVVILARGHEKGVSGVRARGRRVFSYICDNYCPRQPENYFIK